jgi:tRNA A37 threonylcarbamoyladenosine synthetase subunit TsaC/SUA5/YrdC
LIAEQLDHAVDAVIDSGECGTEPATVIDFSQPEPEIAIEVAWVRPERMGPATALASQARSSRLTRN